MFNKTYKPYTREEANYARDYYNCVIKKDPNYRTTSSGFFMPNQNEELGTQYMNRTAGNFYDPQRCEYQQKLYPQRGPQDYGRMNIPGEYGIPKYNTTNTTYYPETYKTYEDSVGDEIGRTIIRYKQINPTFRPQFGNAIPNQTPETEKHSEKTQQPIVSERRFRQYAGETNGGRYYTREGYNEYQGQSAGLSSAEMEEIKKRQESNLKGKGRQYTDPKDQAAGVTSAEYEEIKRRQAMNKPTQINYSVMRSGYPSQEGMMENQPQFQYEEAQGATNAQPPQYIYPSGGYVDRQPERNPNIQYEQAQPQELRQNYQTTQHFEKPMQQNSTYNQNNQQIKTDIRPTVGTGCGGGKILESNESSGVYNAINQGYIHNVNNVSNTFGRGQMSNNIEDYNNSQYGIPLQDRPALKQGVESNESYGASACLNANFVPYDGSVGPRQILDIREYGPRTGPTSYNIAGGNQSSGVCGVFHGK